ncbi:hypothetical protein CDD82_4734 [Ophiocordyceps australis]|uniref:C3H1-type domain-containing protein n=1 Tax=Ophiocordyceps australis TaxID=1399860 RepID=A0A2C5XJR2_9HYPO|nr:hypothetical protein CDD82_4734 [Ophiocordyceps australis]
MTWPALAPRANAHEASTDMAQTRPASQPPLPSSKPPTLQSLPPRNVIPGLGFATPLHHPLPTTFAPYPQPPAPETRPMTTQNHVKKPPVPMAADKGSEEGEISEGEVDHLYQTPPTRAPANPRNAGPAASTLPRNSFRPAASSLKMPHDTHPHADDAFRWLAAPLQLLAPPRQRSGSYSPPVIPPGTHCSVSLPVSRHKDASLQAPVASQASALGPIHPVPPRDASRLPHSTGIPASPPQTVASSKEQARQAILQLWSHDVRYQTYLDHGIDRDILDNLFQELGLPVAQVPTPPKPQEPETMPTQVQAKTPQTSSTSNFPPRALTADAPPAQPAKSIDKSEERKDRIARLLAAKGSKAAAAPPAPVAAPAVTQTAAQAATSKSDKSKLLQQKMEALLQSRAVLGKKRSLPPPASTDHVESRPTKKAALSDCQNSILSIPKDIITKESLVPPDAPEHTSPIPGLFLSPPQPLQTTESVQQKHISSPTPKLASSKLPQRPFDQSTGSRPFLIHVSDDEDAGDMDVDSPHDSHSPTNLGATSLQRPAAIRGLPNISLSRHVSTGASSATPPRSTGGVEDLDKKIEDMKRKIAEAEARKRVKLSQQASPAPSPLPHGSENETLVNTNGAHVSPPASRVGQDHDASASSPAAGSDESRASQDKGQVEPSVQSHQINSHSRSRAASERLPLIEARRKAQLLKLQSLQSQIAAIEQEIQDGMQEEEALKQHLDASDAGEPHGHAQVAEPDAPNTSKQEPLQRDEDSTHSNPMDTTSASSPSFSNSEGSSDSDVAESTDAPQHQATSHVSASTESELVESQSSGAADGHVAIESADDGPTRSSEGESDEYEYEPPDAESSAMQAEPQSRPEPGPKDGHRALLTQAELDEENAPKPVLQVPESSLGHTDSQTDSVPEAARKDMAVLTGQRLEPSGSRVKFSQSGDPAAEKPSSSLAPYETPLHYFHAYRFHPRFKQDVAGGLRSLTYSNKIDVQKQFCLDELQGRECPRGNGCEYQHFDGIKAPDDQILLQLGSADNYRDEEKTEYISGLRQLLTDFRNRKVKDFNTISQGIIDYHARFHGDKFKILPLAGVST